MKIILYLFLNILLLDFIYTFNLSNFDYYYFATKALHEYSSKITGAKSKTNKTKCYAYKNIKVNDILFKYDKKDILSSESCYHPQKEDIFKNISLITNDTYEQNKMLLAFCIYYTLSDPDKNETHISQHEKFHILTLPIYKVKNSELLFDFYDLNDYLIAASSYSNLESDKISKIINKNLNVNITDRKNETFELYSKIYYYISSHSFNISGKAIILPFLDICDIVPYYLNKTNLKYLDSSIVQEEDNKIVVKSKVNILQSEHYYFSYNISLENDLLILKQGIFVHDNIFDRYTVNKHYMFKQMNEADDLYDYLKKHNLNPDLFKFRSENKGRIALLKLELLPDKINDDLYKFGIIYYNWLKTKSNKNNELNNFEKQSLMFIIRMCYDELREIANVMEVDFDEYIYRTQVDQGLSDLNKNLRNFTMEKVHFIQKNINYLYNNLAYMNYHEIMKKKEIYLIKSE